MQATCWRRPLCRHERVAGSVQHSTAATCWRRPVGRHERGCAATSPSVVALQRHTSQARHEGSTGVAEKKVIDTTCMVHVFTIKYCRLFSNFSVACSVTCRCLVVLFSIAQQLHVDVVQLVVTKGVALTSHVTTTSRGKYWRRWKKGYRHYMYGTCFYK